MQLVVFTLGGREYALPIEEVQEIIRAVEPRPVSSDVLWIQGVINLRGRIVPVCDLAARLRLGEELCDTPNIVIVETPAGTAGVIVDHVEEVLTVEQDELDMVPATASDFIDGVVKLGDRLVVMLDTSSMLAGAGLTAASQ